MKREDIEKEAINYDSRLVAFRAFMKGAEWRINSVWHAMEEVQDGKRPYIVQYNEECKFAMFTKPIPLSKDHAKSVFKRWAYIEDLIPMED